MTVMLSDNAKTILEQRYLLRGDDNELKESPDDMFLRVAKSVAQAEKKWGGQRATEMYTEIFCQLMKSLQFLPNSPTLMNAGTTVPQLSACFVLPIEDSMEGIFHTLKKAAIIHQKGGGTGFNFSEIRPFGDKVNSKWGTAFGPVAVIEIFDRVTEKIKQCGKRRGANMGILNINHPDIGSFIGLKAAGDKVSNFNLSVGVTDDFMKAVEADQEWYLVNPRDPSMTSIVNAKEIWSEIVRNAWACGDPGLIFLDTINAQNPVLSLGKIMATNPCGEVPLMPNEACNLGSIDLSKFVSIYKNRAVIDWEELENAIPLAIRFLDDVIEINQYPDEGIEKATMSNRKIGLGVMGWADLLVKLKIPYASMEAVRLGEQLMEFIANNSRRASSTLAIVRGNFPNWQESVYFPDEPMRNATRTSIAPTGTISIIADTSASIEPLFALAYQRVNVLDDTPLITVNSLFLKYLSEQKLDKDFIMERVKVDGSCSDISDLDKSIRDIFKTALEIEPFWHIRHQEAFQHFTDNAVSKTINLPNTATVETVKSIYMEAWKRKLKGITLFRNDTGNKQVLQRGIEVSSHICKVCI